MWPPASAGLAPRDYGFALNGAIIDNVLYRFRWFSHVYRVWVPRIRTFGFSAGVRKVKRVSDLMIYIRIL